jgi:phosphoglycolate phosphatase
MDILLTYLARRPYSHLIWDWNGTLLDDLFLCNEILSELLEEHGLPKITQEKHRDLFQFPVAEFYKKLGFDLTSDVYRVLADKYTIAYRNRVHRCNLFVGVEDFLLITKNKGISHSVLSASLQNDLISQLTHYRIHHFFDHIYGLSDNLAASKVKRGKELIKHSNLPPSLTLLIGDTDHDLDVGQQLGVDVLLIADGHQSYARLSAIHDQVIRTKVPDRM